LQSDAVRSRRHAGSAWFHAEFGDVHGPIPDGSINLGGPIVTVLGFVFIVGTIHPSLRAFDIRGKELWNAELPASGNATPMTYEFNGKRYVVIAAGGHRAIPQEAQGRCDSRVRVALMASGQRTSLG
jgi:glucose dehydrogenase